MITANEAKQLVENSAKNVDDYIEKEFSQHIRALSIQGLREFIKHLGAIEPLKEFKLTAIEKAAINKLQKLGYSVRVERYGNSYVPLGLQNDFDASGPLHTNYGIIVEW